MFGRLRRKIPLIVLVLLSPAIAELLSGSSPPLEFINPPAFIILIGLYGSGILIVRELSIKWDKGWGGVILLGMAYGIIEEGLAVKSFFNPNWMDLNVLGTYGRWIGVNWVWVVCLTVFHVVYSIVLPILLFDMIFPSLKNKRLLGRKGLGICFIVLFFITGFCCLLLVSYRPDDFLYLATAIIVVILFIGAWKVPIACAAGRNVYSSARPRWFFIIGAIFGFLVFFIMYGVPHIVTAPLIPIVLEILLCLLVLRFIAKRSGYDKNAYHDFAFASGLLSPLILLSFIHESNGAYGMSIVGLFFIGFLFWLRRRIRKNIDR